MNKIITLSQALLSKSPSKQRKTERRTKYLRKTRKIVRFQKKSGSCENCTEFLTEAIGKQYQSPSPENLL